MKRALVVALLCLGCADKHAATVDQPIPSGWSADGSAVHIEVWFTSRDRPIFGYVARVHGQRVGIVEKKDQTELALRVLWVDLSSPTVERWTLEDSSQRMDRFRLEREAHLQAMQEIREMPNPAPFTREELLRSRFDQWRERWLTEELSW